MNSDQREIHRKKRVVEYAERIGNINKACRYFGIARSSFYVWRDRSRELGDEGIKTSDAPVYRVCKRHGMARLPNRVGRRAVQ